MFLIFFLCINFCLLHSCVAYVYCGDRPKSDHDIILINSILISENSDEIQSHMNYAFKRKCGDVYDIQEEYLFESNDELEFLKNMNTVILYSNSSQDEWKSQGLVYAGNVYYNTSITSRTCSSMNNVTVCHDTAKLVNTHFEKNYADLFHFITQMQYNDGDVVTRDSCSTIIQNPSELKTVLLCVDDDAAKEIKTYAEHPLKLKIAKDCHQYFRIGALENYVAVVTSRPPYRPPTEYSMPIIFYKTPFLSPDVEQAFPNSIKLVKQELLKYGFLEFIKAVDWHRVTIITDDTFQSIEFETELVKTFDENKITYKVLRCPQNCDIYQELRDIRGVAIANVEERNARDLVQNNRWLTWLVRGTPEVRTLSEYSFVFAFTIGSGEQYPFQKHCQLDNDALSGLNTITDAYSDLTNKDNIFEMNINKKQFYELLTTRAKELAKNTWTNIYVHRIRPTWREEVMTLRVDNYNDIKIENFKNPFEGRSKPNDGTEQCLLRTYVYDKPCQDFLVIGYMLVIMMFTFCILMITCYFDETAPINDPRYQIFR